jgi:hypothetical protein
VLARISMPSLAAFSWTSRRGRTSLIAWVRTSITGLGVAAGTEMPFQLTTSKSLIPLSWTVGTSGRYEVRCGPVDASTRIFLSLIRPCIAA